MKAVIISGGKSPSKDILLEAVKDADIIIGADKGCEILHEYSISPDYILGDFDSANIEVINSMEASGVEKITFKKEKDLTDTEIAFELAIEKGANKILLLGVTGTRYDHSLSNIGLMLKGLKKEVYVEIVDDNNKIFLTDKNILLKGSKGDIVSFHAYSEIVKSLTISGAKYELFNYDLSLGDGLTTSNEFVGRDIKVTFDSGILMVIYTRD